MFVSRDYLFKVILPHPLVRENPECLALVFDAMRMAFNGTGDCFFSQSPRNCLKTHEDAIVACGEDGMLCYIPSNKHWYELDEFEYEHTTPSSPFHAVSACHGKLYVLGGTYRWLAGGNSVERYDPLLNRWVCTKPPEIVCSQSAAVTLQGFLYVVGGIDRHEMLLRMVQKYNPDTNLWQEVSPLSSPRSKACAVADGSYLYAIGGSDSTALFLDIVERFDPSNNTWETLPSTLARRANAGGAAIKQKVFVVGGLHPGATDHDPCEIYDPLSKVWSSIPSLVAPRQLASAVSFKGQILVFGDFRHQGGQEMSLQAYDADQNKWEACSDISFGSKFFKISCLRIPRHVLGGCRQYTSS